MRIQISKQHLASIICKLVAHMYLKRYSIFDNNHHNEHGNISNKTFNVQGRKELIGSIYTLCSIGVLLLLKMMKTLLMISSMMMCMLVGMMMIRMCSNVISRMRWHWRSHHSHAICHRWISTVNWYRGWSCKL